MTPRIVPGSDGQRDAVDRDVVAEVLARVVDDDRGVGIGFGGRLGGVRRVRRPVGGCRSARRRLAPARRAPGPAARAGRCVHDGAPRVRRAWRWRLRRRVGGGGLSRPRIPHGRGRDDEVSGAAAIGRRRPLAAGISGIANGLATWLRERGPARCDGARRPDRAIVRSCPTRRRPEPDAPPDAARASRARPACATPPTRARGSPALAPAKGFTYRDADGTTVRDRGDPRPHPRAGHPAGLDRRLDLPVADRPPPGQPAATRAAASSTAITPTGTQRRGTDKFDRMLAFAEALPRIRRRCDADLATARPAAREGPGRGRPAAGADAHPRRQRRVRAAQPLLRADDAARSPRPDRGRGRAVPVPRQVRPARTRSGCAIGAWPASSAAARSCPARSCSSTSTTTARSATSRRTTSTTTSARPPGGDFTAKDFRTWAGTVLAYRALRALQPGIGERAAKRNVVEAIRQTADRLGNTPAVARGSYVHPAVLEAYLDGVDPRSAGRGGRGAGDPADRRDTGRGEGRSGRSLRQRLRRTPPDRRRRAASDRTRGDDPERRRLVRRRTRSRGARIRSRPSPCSRSVTQVLPRIASISRPATYIAIPGLSEPGAGSAAGNSNRLVLVLAPSACPVRSSSRHSTRLSSAPTAISRSAATPAARQPTFAMRLRSAWARAFGSAAAGGGVPSSRSMTRSPGQRAASICVPASTARISEIGSRVTRTASCSRRVRTSRSSTARKRRAASAYTSDGELAAHGREEVVVAGQDGAAGVDRRDRRAQLVRQHAEQRLVLGGACLSGVLGRLGECGFRHAAKGRARDGPPSVAGRRVVLRALLRLRRRS